MTNGCSGYEAFKIEYSGEKIKGIGKANLDAFGFIYILKITCLFDHK